MSEKSTHTPPRQIRIGDDWLDFDAAAKSQGTERAALVREFIAWYLRRPGAKLPTRPSAVSGEHLDPAGTRVTRDYAAGRLHSAEQPDPRSTP